MHFDMLLFYATKDKGSCYSGVNLKNFVDFFSSEVNLIKIGVLSLKYPVRISCLQTINQPNKVSVMGLKQRKRHTGNDMPFGLI